MFPTESLHRGSFRQVPNSNSFVLSAGYDELMLGMEKRRRHVVEMSPARVNLPCLRLAHAPDLDLPVVRSRYNERQRRVERSPVDATVMTLEHVLHGREVVEGVEGTRSGVWGAFRSPVMSQTQTVWSWDDDTMRCPFGWN